MALLMVVLTALLIAWLIVLLMALLMGLLMVPLIAHTVSHRHTPLSAFPLSLVSGSSRTILRGNFYAVVLRWLRCHLLHA